jgi:hypothetical protein
MNISSCKFIAAFLGVSFFLISCGDNRPLNVQKQLSGESAASLPDTSSDAERVVIKTADITMDVDQVEHSVQQFQDLVNRMNGHVFHYELQNEKQLQQEVQQSHDSLLQITSIHPGALMKLRVPAQYGEPFISAVLRMPGSIETFLFDENDVTEAITEKKELMMTDAGLPLHKKTRDMIPENEGSSETAENFIKRKADFTKMNYQSKYLWFDIRLRGKNYTSQQTIASSPVLHVPFSVRAADALQTGWYGLSSLITLLLNLWPVYIIGLVLLFFIRKIPYIKSQQLKRIDLAQNGSK